MRAGKEIVTSLENSLSRNNEPFQFPHELEMHICVHERDPAEKNRLHDFSEKSNPIRRLFCELNDNADVFTAEGAIKREGIGDDCGPQDNFIQATRNPSLTRP